MSDTATPPVGKSSSGLSGMLLPELKQLAQSLGITGSSAMRKGDLIEAIGTKQSSSRTEGKPPRSKSTASAEGAEGTSRSESNGRPARTGDNPRNAGEST
ncbi:MAG: Rho termination factor N-terminal domain-containing protein, partial [Candidatus Nanopelagicales bacterium]|nr:Rho termination factor N-terminal domain-containing protein [Candidatus Nanopelagicales bacterium]